MRDEFSNSGAVEAVSQSIYRIVGEHSQDQQYSATDIVILDTALPALFFLTQGQSQSLEQLAAQNNNGGFELILKTLNAYSSSGCPGTGFSYGLSLLSSLASLESATPSQVDAAAAAVWQAAKQQVAREQWNIDLIRAAVRAMGDISVRALARGHELSTYVVEGISMTKNLVETYENKVCCFQRVYLLIPSIQQSRCLFYTFW